MANITVFNKGKRSWVLKDCTGHENRVNPTESIVMEESAGKNLVEGYPRDFTTSGPSVIDNTELMRREQSVKDKERSLKEKEAMLDKREKEIAEREKALADLPERHSIFSAHDLQLPCREPCEPESEQEPTEEQELPKRHAGRPPKNAEK